MQPAQSFPNRVTVRATPPVEGLAISLRFKMQRKNDFYYLLFTGANEICDVSKEQLLRAFDEDREFFIMDYVDPRVGFTGEIICNLLSDEDLRRALDAYQMFYKEFRYPEGHVDRLKAALARGQNPCDYKVELTSE